MSLNRFGELMSAMGLAVLPVGALMFTASDIAVVRDRFVTLGFVNLLWGLPLCYAAQRMIAWSIAVVYI